MSHCPSSSNLLVGWVAQGKTLEERLELGESKFWKTCGSEASYGSHSKETQAISYNIAAQSLSY